MTSASAQSWSSSLLPQALEVLVLYGRVAARVPFWASERTCTKCHHDLLLNAMRGASGIEVRRS